jgi:hypothetical protein
VLKLTLTGNPAGPGEPDVAVYAAPYSNVGSLLKTVEPRVMISAPGETEYCTPLFVATKQLPMVLPACAGLAAVGSVRLHRDIPPVTVADSCSASHARTVDLFHTRRLPILKLAGPAPMLAQ